MQPVIQQQQLNGHQLDADAAPIDGRETKVNVDETASPITTDLSMDDGQTASWHNYDRSSSKKDAYVLAFAEELFSSIRSYNLDTVVVELMYQALPGFLKMFALSFAHRRQSQVYRDIMAFVHQYKWLVY